MSRVLKLGNYEVFGAGAKLLVSIGRGGHIVRVVKAWEDIVLWDHYPIISQKSAYSELKKGRADCSEGAAGEIYDVQIVYYAHPNKQEYLQPSYMFKRRDRKNKDDLFEVFVPAIKKKFYLKDKMDPEIPGNDVN